MSKSTVIFRQDNAIKPNTRMRGFCTVLSIGILTVTSATAKMGPFKTYKMGGFGSRLGGTSLVDIDKDGDLDFVSHADSKNGGGARWWEYQSPSKWVMHTISHKKTSNVSGVAMHVDDDGWIDYVAGHAWFKNPGKKGGEWKATNLFGGKSGHDLRSGDLDGDGKMDIVSTGRGNQFWVAQSRRRKALAYATHWNWRSYRPCHRRH